MTTPRPAAGRASASGVRRGGDRFQDLFVWAAAMNVIRPTAEYTQVEVEINGVGNVDDVVLRGAPGSSDLYGQVKWATNPAELVNTDYLQKTDSDTSKSLLQKLFDSWTKVQTKETPPTLQLITNRALDGADPLLGHVDGRTDLLVPYAADASSRSSAGKALLQWAEHVGTSREQLLEMLAHLQFLTGRTVSAEESHVRTLMAVAGLDPSEEALERGLGIVGRWVVDGRRVATATDIHDAVDERGLRRVEPSALLVVQAIDADPHADEGTVTLDWVHLYEPDQSPKMRVQPRDPASWWEMDRDITQAAATLENEGWRSTVVRGAFRQATFFQVGAALPDTRGHELRYVQNQQLWSTDSPKASIDQPDLARTPIGAGSDLAVAVGVATNPTTAVVAYLRSAGTPVDGLLTVQPAAGPDDRAVANAGQAVAYAQQIRDRVRQELDLHPAAERVHLFLAGPGGLALLLGHRWNRLRPTVVYEHLGPGRGYTPAFTVDA